ncbi:MAG: SusC/RagA family TonB-linked outer membrane protein, partial [Bacteroidales bacterium]|nr:SusC/RagA family TonB-linked outer membrane protein [Bacteroidales bacterium]
TPIKSGNYIIQEGKEVNSFYLATSAGVDPATGDKLYWAWKEDVDAGGKVAYITDSPSVASANRHVCGSRIPDLYGSISNELRFWDFDFNLLCTYSIGGKVLDGAYYQHLYSTYAGTAAHVDRKKAWKEPGDVTSIPRIDLGGSSNIIYTEDNLTSASYFTIKSFTLGYTLPSRWVNAIKMKSVRCTLSGDNLCMFSARKGLDPQYNFTGGTGYTYIPERTISLGVEINF